jgi:hypothetical protein
LLPPPLRETPSTLFPSFAFFPPTHPPVSGWIQAMRNGFETELPPLQPDPLFDRAISEVAMDIPAIVNSLMWPICVREMISLYEKSIELPAMVSARLRERCTFICKFWF